MSIPQYSEADTRAKLIDPAIHKRGWTEDFIRREGQGGQKRIINIKLNISSNLRTQAHRIIKRAGLKPWGKTFQNLRSSRETELVEDFPVHVVTEWLGNSPDVARKHYLQTHEGHFQRAVEKR